MHNWWKILMAHSQTGVLPVSLLSPVLFSMVVNTLGDGVYFSKICKRHQAAMGLQAIWKTGSEFKMILIMWRESKIDQINVNKNKCKVLPIGRIKQMNKRRIESN